MASEKTMTMKRFEEVVGAYGADSERWPAAEREAAMSLADRSAAARAHLEAAAELDALLDVLPPPPVSAGLEARILAAAPSADNTERDRQNKVIPLPSRRRFLRYAVAPLAAAAMAVLWLGIPRDARIEAPNIEVVSDAEEHLLYAFADPDGFTAAMETQGILPEDYLALADAFEVPVDDLLNGE